MSYSLEYEWARAARWRGYDHATFDALEHEYQALTIAEYRIEQRIQAVDTWISEQERKDHGTATRRRPARRR